jgi:hypothetical protein
VKVFDNLYFVGEKEYSAWAVVVSVGGSFRQLRTWYSLIAELPGDVPKFPGAKS